MELTVDSGRKRRHRVHDNPEDAYRRRDHNIPRQRKHHDQKNDRPKPVERERYAAKVGIETEARANERRQLNAGSQRRCRERARNANGIKNDSMVNHDTPTQFVKLPSDTRLKLASNPAPNEIVLPELSIITRDGNPYPVTYRNLAEVAMGHENSLSTTGLLKRKHDHPSIPTVANSQPKKADVSFVPPIRQTASIFKQSVTIVKSEGSVVRSDIMFGTQDKPKQLFWEKRLQGLQACDKDEQIIESFELPKKVKAVGLELSDDTLLRSIATALHINGHPITGQNRPKQLLDKSPGVFINPDQPLVLGLHVTDEDILEQEKKVENAREKLKEVMNQHHN